jgi:glucose-6-phosphate 1-epimerase
MTHIVTLCVQMAQAFDIPNALRFEKAPGGLARAVISTPAAEAEIYLHGAHIAQWTPRGERSVFFLSSRSQFTAGKPIRGGVPIAFPWFGPPKDGSGPLHGYARISQWTVEGSRLHDGGEVEIAFALSAAPFDLRFRVTVGRELTMELETRNAGADPVTFEEALHSYFAIGDIRQASVSGLEGTTYIDKTDGSRRKQSGSDALRIAKETDQVHMGTEASCVIHDPAWNRRITIAKRGSHTTVVWNPWIEKSAAIGDMAPDDWQNMICVETANAVNDAVHLQPEAVHALSARISVS